MVGQSAPLRRPAVRAKTRFDTRRDLLVELAKRHAVPTIYHFREFVDAGGLMSYGVSFSDAYRQVGRPGAQGREAR
jgi:putative ABC transport system substrate-binding protein